MKRLTYHPPSSSQGNQVALQWQTAQSRWHYASSCWLNWLQQWSILVPTDRATDPLESGRIIRRIGFVSYLGIIFGVTTEYDIVQYRITSDYDIAPCRVNFGNDLVPSRIPSEYDLIFYIGYEAVWHCGSGGGVHADTRREASRDDRRRNRSHWRCSQGETTIGSLCMREWLCNHYHYEGSSVPSPN